jgi:hypothetical protein
MCSPYPTWQARRGFMGAHRWRDGAHPHSGPPHSFHDPRVTRTRTQGVSPPMQFCHQVASDDQPHQGAMAPACHHMRTTQTDPVDIPVGQSTLDPAPRFICRFMQETEQGRLCKHPGESVLHSTLLGSHQTSQVESSSLMLERPLPGREALFVSIQTG